MWVYISPLNDIYNNSDVEFLHIELFHVQYNIYWLQNFLLYKKSTRTCEIVNYPEKCFRSETK